MRLHQSPDQKRGETTKQTRQVNKVFEEVYPATAGVGQQLQPGHKKQQSFIETKRP
jgi:hypothetical protein